MARGFFAWQMSLGLLDWMTFIRRFRLGFNEGRDMTTFFLQFHPRTSVLNSKTLEIKLGANVLWHLCHEAVPPADPPI